VRGGQEGAETERVKLFCCKNQKEGETVFRMSCKEQVENVDSLRQCMTHVIRNAPSQFIGDVTATCPSFRGLLSTAVRKDYNL
jgi:hypothetical protein